MTKAKKTSSKYSPEIAELICETIERTGSEKTGYLSAKISKSTYGKWKEEKEGFALKVIEARYKFLQQNAKIFRMLAVNAMYDTMCNGQVTCTKTTKKERVQVEEKNREGEIVVKSKLVVTDVSEKIIYRGIPQYLIDKYSAPPIDEFTALNKLIEAGWYHDDAVAEIPEEVEKLKEKVREILLRNRIE